MRKFVSIAPAVTVFMLTLATLAAIPLAIARAGHASERAQIRLAAQVIEADDILARIDQAQTAVADIVMPSVVHIETTRRERRSRGLSSGTGWVFDEQGHIVTNAHVIRSAQDITVQFANGRTAEAVLVADDAYTDIAVLRIEPGVGLFPMERATSEAVRQGQQVFAFGSPFGFKFSMSKGIVSGLGRDPSGAFAATRGFTNFIQTDAAVNPGNSGGPLVDIKGRLIGMNVAIATGRETDGTTVEGGQSAGISFAIPLNVIESIVTQLIAGDIPRRGYLGIQMSNGRNGNQEVFFNGQFWGMGVQVASVVSGTAADGAGVQPDDIITAFDGQRTPTSAVLRSLISTTGPNTPTELTVFRDGRFVELEVVLDEFAITELVGPDFRDTIRAAGLQIETVNRGGGRPFITRVQDGSRADRAGIRRGLLITEVNGESVEDLPELVERMTAAGWFTNRTVQLTLSDPRNSIDGYTVELRNPR
ncbi:MAG: trypsin-like peptidase domain-containing protein [Planctomycetota bacterium]